jgi:hypothetical protein
MERLKSEPEARMPKQARMKNAQKGRFVDSTDCIGAWEMFRISSFEFRAYSQCG